MSDQDGARRGPAEHRPVGRRVLVTNDDGISSDGIGALARALHASGYEVVVAAPDANMSGAAAAIGPVGTHVGLRRVSVPGLAAADAYAIAAPPGMIVVAALAGAFGPAPDLVASGVNAGVNLGRAVLHSGTVGAAMTAQNLGVPAIAVSVEPGGDWDVAASHGVRAIDGWSEEPTARHRVVVANVNVPCGARLGTPHERTHLASFGTVSAAALDDRLDFRLVIDASQFDEPHSDADALRRGVVSVTWLEPIGPVRSADRPDAGAVRLEAVDDVASSASASPRSAT